MFSLKPLATFYGCTAWFVSDLVAYPEDNVVSHDAALICHRGQTAISRKKFDFFILRNVGH